MTTQKKVLIGIGAGLLTLCCVGSLLAAAQLLLHGGSDTLLT